MTDHHLSLPAAFELQAPALVAMVGGGGKSSLLFALAAALPGRVVVTTTTRIFAAQMELAAATCLVDELDQLENKLAAYGACLVVGKVAGDKALGVEPELPALLLNRPDVDFVLVEADGSRMRPIKVPAAHEPVVPRQTNLLVPVLGIDALDKPIEAVAHRPELVKQLLLGSGLSAERLGVEAIARLITHPKGGLKNVPEGTRVVPFVNKVETWHQLAAARHIARLMLGESRIDAVVVGAAKHKPVVSEVIKRVIGVVLAAGQSSRMGQTKQLMPWGERTVLGQTIHHLQQSSLHDLLLVSGHEATTVAAIAVEMGVSQVHNPEYARGEMLSSLKIAVSQLPPRCAAILVMLADQPMIEPETIDQLLLAFWRGEGELIAPVYRGQRGNPVLIGRRYFDELMALPADGAPRMLLQRHQDRLRLVPVTTDSVLRDLDRPGDYHRWRPKDV